MARRASSSHPLDTELVDFVDGTLEPSQFARIEAHLAACLLCRIQRQRISAEPPLAPIDLEELRIPTFGRLEVTEAPGDQARAGQLWLTVGDEAQMVLVRKVRENGWGVIVAPAILDTNAADAGAFVLDATASPLGTPLAVYDDVTVSLPLTALVERVEPVRDVDLLKLSESSTGVTRGSGLTGDDDPRHEIRQYLVDQLARLDPAFTDDDIDGEPAAAAFEAFRDAIHFRRPRCFIDALDLLPRLQPFANAWSGFASVKEFGVHLIVINTPAGLNDAMDLTSGSAVITRLAGSALLVRNALGETVELYEPPALFRAWNVATGERSSEPTIWGLDLHDTVIKYLDLKSRVLRLGDSDGPVNAVDVHEVLAAKSAEAIAHTAGRSSRFSTNEAKKRGYGLVASLDNGFAAALDGVLSHEFAPDDVATLVDRIDE